jgi:hypothetical protein
MDVHCAALAGIYKTVYIFMTTRVYSFCAAVPKRIVEKHLKTKNYVFVWMCTVQHLQVFTKTVYICMTTRVYSFCVQYLHCISIISSHHLLALLIANFRAAAERESNISTKENRVS